MSITESSTADHPADDTGTSGPTSAILYAHASPQQQQVTVPAPQQIEGLTLRLPPTSPRWTQALLTLCVTAPFARGGSQPGIQFSIVVDDDRTVAQGCFTTASSENATGRSPISMTVAVPLVDYHQGVTAKWAGVRESTGIIDDVGYASLSAVLG